VEIPAQTAYIGFAPGDGSLRIENKETKHEPTPNQTGATTMSDTRRRRRNVPPGSPRTKRVRRAAFKPAKSGSKRKPPYPPAFGPDWDIVDVVDVMTNYRRSKTANLLAVIAVIALLVTLVFAAGYSVIRREDFSLVEHVWIVVGPVTASLLAYLKMEGTRRMTARKP
jgi:hypothetical protein